MDLATFSLRLVTATGLGIVIGLERQLSRHLAGLQTNTLVATGAALYVMVAELSNLPTMDTRIVGQIVTGIGFIGTGVIMRDGLHVRGLNTAATLWGAGAVGTLAGYGFIVPAALAAISVLFINTVLRRLSWAIDRKSRAPVSADFHYTVVATIEKHREDQIRSEMLQLLSLAKLSLHSFETAPGENGTCCLDARVSSQERNDSTLSQIAASFGRQDGVLGLRWQAISPKMEE